MDRTAMTEPPDAFLERWSRRKLERAEEREPVVPAAEREAAVANVPAEQRPSLTDADMPPVESLGDDDDYSGFLSAGVSDGLRRIALRRLFHGAKYNVTDGLDDYAEDFAGFAPLGDIVTADMKHHMQRLIDKFAEAPDDAEGGQGTAAVAADDVEQEPRADEESACGKKQGGTVS